jgi:hypothetical protein
VSFVQVTALTECPEGTIVRTISRLDETCREVRNAARILGDPLLFRTAETASQCIKRDVGTPSAAFPAQGAEPCARILLRVLTRNWFPLRTSAFFITSSGDLRAEFVALVRAKARGIVGVQGV